jgi:hypothetical protein
LLATYALPRHRPSCLRRAVYRCRTPAAGREVGATGLAAPRLGVQFCPRIDSGDAAGSPLTPAPQAYPLLHQRRPIRPPAHVRGHRPSARRPQSSRSPPGGIMTARTASVSRTTAETSIETSSPMAGKFVTEAIASSIHAQPHRQACVRPQYKGPPHRPAPHRRDCGMRSVKRSCRHRTSGAGPIGSAYMPLTASPCRCGLSGDRIAGPEVVTGGQIPRPVHPLPRVFAPPMKRTCTSRRWPKSTTTTRWRLVSRRGR